MHKRIPATVGYIGEVVPAELIEAAGLTPLRITGGGITSTPLVDSLWSPRRRADPSASADAILERALRGEFAELALLVIPHTTKAIEGIATAIEAARRDGVSGLPPVHLLDRSFLTGLASSEYNARQFRLLTARLESIGEELTDVGIGRASRAYRDLRDVRSDLAALRRAPGCPISGTEAFEALLRTWAMPAHKAAQHLRQVMTAPRPTPPNVIRVFLAGSRTDTSAWHRAVEERGGIVVGEDDGWDPLPEEDAGGKPLVVLESRWCEPHADAVAYPMSAHLEATLRRISRAGPDVVVFVVHADDGLGTWETPEVVRLLDARAIPSLHLGGQPYVPDATTDLSPLDEFLSGRTP